jgi:hypothetical protein
MSSPLFNYFESYNTSGEDLLAIQCVSFFSTSFFFEIFFSPMIFTEIRTESRVGLYIRSPLSTSNLNQDLNGLLFFLILKFHIHDNPCSGPRVVSCIETDAQTDIGAPQVCQRAQRAEGHAI